MKITFMGYDLGECDSRTDDGSDWGIILMDCKLNDLGKQFFIGWKEDVHIDLCINYEEGTMVAYYNNGETAMKDKLLPNWLALAAVDPR